MRDVNGAGRVRVVAYPYLIRWINICFVLILISVGIHYVGTRIIF